MVTQHLADIRAASQASVHCVSRRDGAIAGGHDDIMPLTSSATPARPMAAVRPAPELSIIVPTFNERNNVPLLVERLERLLTECDWEVVFVDDNSPDGTAAARAIGEGDSRACAAFAVSAAAVLPARAWRACLRVRLVMSR
jgi:hypothetical protein